MLLYPRPCTNTSGEDYEGDYGGGDLFADKRFRRRTAKGTAAAAAAGRTSPTPTGTAVSGGDYSGLSYVFAGEGKDDGGGGLPRPNHEAAHVSTGRPESYRSTIVFPHFFSTTA